MFFFIYSQEWAQLLPIFFYKSQLWIIPCWSQVYHLVIFISPELNINVLKVKIFKRWPHFIGLCHLLKVFENGKYLKILYSKPVISKSGPMKIKIVNLVPTENNP